MKNLCVPASLFLSVFLFSLWVYADFEFYRGARSLGMGGTGIAVANDETSLMTNPNGLRRIRTPIFTLLDPEITSSVGAAKPFLGAAVLNAIDPQEVYDQMSDLLEEPNYFKGQVFPSFVMRNFGLGFLAKYESLALRETSGLFHYKARNDMAVVSGFNTSLQGGRIKLGFNARGIQRTEFFGIRNPAVDSMVLGDFAKTGEALGVDAGLTFSLPWQFLPTAAVVINNIGGTSFRGDSSLGEPASVPQTVDFGVALFPILNNLVFGTITLDYIDAFSGQSQGDFLDKARLGMEWNHMDTWLFRAGYLNQDWTAGLEYTSNYLQLQFATYNEEVQFAGFNMMEDRRWVLKVNFRR